MMKRIAWIGTAVALAALGACAGAPSETISRAFDQAGFDGVSASSGVNVVLKQGPFDIRAEGPAAKIDKLRIEQKDGVLVIRRESDMGGGWFRQLGRDVVTVSAPDYALIEASGGADIDVEPLRLDVLDIKASGGADVNADGLTLDTLRIRSSGGADVNAYGLAITTLVATSSGGADIRVSGTCKTATVESSGGADFKGADLRCETATVRASGGSDANITATVSADGRASAGGDVRFSGNPVSFTKEESGGGDVTSGR